MNKYFGIDDGYGIVGCGFICDYCKKENLFVGGNEEEVCNYCKKENKFEEEYEF